ncbi:acyl-CoA dehydrogenase family protein [[Mycobacterium] vasticus]|uniref:Acyl-CoA dehydrogenase family protein n=1 Tax=[Mycobacterium] vasticus TaxID=2875777 RepID=A0ABU5Z277_9MYCO|nr:acyl-CoA dehydrogenase family protein [Mycolicibacter sp. MYC017]MEB3070724.1 acyl-CoA dehydrogenase family protein [Mycolicibacter sp. MYC017]
MDLKWSEAERGFREEVRIWLQENVSRQARPSELHECREFDLAWQRRQYDGGWAGISWPTEYGGRGLGLAEQMIWYEEYARAGAPPSGTNFVGLNHAGPTLIARATDTQRKEHLPKILHGESIWCQGFSEPEAGSDLAGLKARAVIDGDDLVVNGQKTWTSYADVADYQELLVRTDPDAPKHKGISWVICDMRLPGIEIRPITTMHGEQHFCEVFYDDVRIPLKNVVGELNDGWSVAMSTLSFERGTAFMADQIELAHQLENIVHVAHELPGPTGKASAFADDEIRRRLATVRAEVAALRAMTYMNVSRIARQQTPGPEGSQIRFYYSQVLRRVYDVAMDVLGAGSVADEGERHPLIFGYLNSFRSSISAGTKDIQRNIIGERILGLPRSR